MIAEPRVPMPPASPFAHHWGLDPDIIFLNHGSFGACPRTVMDHQAELRRRMEAEPVRFFVRELDPLLHQARVELATVSPHNVFSLRSAARVDDAQRHRVIGR